MEFVRTAAFVSFYALPSSIPALSLSLSLSLRSFSSPVLVERLSSRLFVCAFVRRGARTESQIGNFPDSPRLVWKLASHELCIPTGAREGERESVFNARRQRFRVRLGRTVILFAKKFHVWRSMGGTHGDFSPTADVAHRIGN